MQRGYQGPLFATGPQAAGTASTSFTAAATSAAMVAMNMTCGGAVNINDLVVAGPDARVYSAVNADYAGAVYGAAIGSAALIPTTIANYTTEPFAQCASGRRLACAILPDGSVAMCIINGSSSYMQVVRYSANGALLGSVVIDAVNPYSYYSQMQVTILSGGNILVTWFNNNTYRTGFIILSPLLAVVTAATYMSVAYSTYATYHQPVCALTGGGFAIGVVQNVASVPYLQVATFSAIGVVVSALTTVSASIPAYVFMAMVGLSNGGFVISWNNSASAQTYYATVSSTGVIACVATLIGSSSAINPILISSFSGYFAIIAMLNTNNYSNFFVFNNAGVQQGSTGQDATANIQAQNLFNDGTQFWFTSLTPGSATIRVFTIPITGGSNSNQTNIALPVTAYNTNSSYDPVTNRINIVLEQSTASALSAYLIWVDAANPTAYLGYATVNNVPTSISGYNAVSFPSSDGTVMVVWDQNALVLVGMTAIKTASYVIVGVAGRSAAAGAQTVVIKGVSTGSAYFPINTIKGSNSKAFDQSAVYPTGNKGLTFPTSVLLKGIA